MSRVNVDSNFSEKASKILQTNKHFTENDFNLLHYITSLYGNALSAKGINLIDPIYANMFYYNKMRSMPLTDMPYVTRTYAFFTRPELNFSRENINSIPFFKWLYDKPIGKMIMSSLTDPEYFINAPGFLNSTAVTASQIRETIQKLDKITTGKTTFDVGDDKKVNVNGMSSDMTAFNGDSATISSSAETQSSNTSEQEDDQDAVNELMSIDFSSLNDDAAIDNILTKTETLNEMKKFYSSYQKEVESYYNIMYDTGNKLRDTYIPSVLRAKEIMIGNHRDEFDKFNFTSPFIPLLMNTCTNLTGARDFSLANYEYEEDEFSVKQNVATGMDDLWGPGTLNVTHKDIAYGPVSLLYMLWIYYIHYVSRGYIMSTREHILERILDYTCSIYVFVIGADGRSIERFGKYTGCYPISFPFAQQLEHNQEINPAMLQDINVTFQYNRFEPMNPEIFTDFNFVSETEWLFKLKNWDKLYDRKATLNEEGLRMIRNRSGMNYDDLVAIHAAGRSALIWDRVKDPGMSGKVPRALLNGTDILDTDGFSHSDMLNNYWGGYPTIVNGKELIWVLPQWDYESAPRDLITGKNGKENLMSETH